MPSPIVLQRDPPRFDFCDGIEATDAARDAYVAARTDAELVAATDALMSMDVELVEIEALTRERGAALLAARRAPASVPCACGFGPILAEADRLIAARAARRAGVAA